MRIYRKLTPEQQAEIAAEKERWRKTQKKYVVGKASLEIDGYDRTWTTIRFSYDGDGFESTVKKDQVLEEVKRIKSSLKG